MNNKGVFITLTIFLLAAGVLALSQSIRHNFNELEGNNKYVVMTDRVGYKYENIQDNIFDIIENISGIDFNIGEKSITFTEELPNARSLDAMEISIGAYKKFVEEHKDGLDINMNITDFDLSTFTIMPYDINYSHADAPGRGNRHNNTIYYEPSSLDFNAYVVEVILQNQTYDEVEEDIDYADMAGEQGVNLLLIVRNSVKIEEFSKFYEGIDANAESEITISTTGNAEKDVHITITPFGKMTVLNNNSVAVDIVTGIDFGDDATEEPYLELLKGLVVVRSPRLKIEKR
ncbi:MAG: hypothetical protein ABIE23_06220 [archaeon]